MRKGIFFTMDAVLALYITFMMMSIMMVMIETSQSYSEDSLSLARLSRDIYEVRKYDSSLSLPGFVSVGPDCGSQKTVGSAFVLQYGDIDAGGWNIQSEIYTKYEKVCMNE